MSNAQDLTSIIVSTEHRMDIPNIWTDNGTSQGHSANVWSTKVYNGMPKAFPEGIPKPAQLRRMSPNCKRINVTPLNGITDIITKFTSDIYSVSLFKKFAA
ncbi:hypothetical protein PUN28_002548 [Cardiocondyla obscurior]|uniref:Uncharacterized protein n=1 Tax=Cardiocondyla obscurior TaxID=286306 RepID=A0AAW2GUX9_9HYME